MSQCIICGKWCPQEVDAVYRVNAKGKPGRFACAPHYKDGRALYPKDDPNAPPVETETQPDSDSLGPWTGGTTDA